MTEQEQSNQTIPAEQAQNCEPWQMPTLESQASTVSAIGSGSRPRASASSRPLPMTASKIEALHKQAQQEGFEQGQQQGYQAGMQRAQAELDEKLAQLNRVMGQLMTPLEEQQSELEQALVNLSMHLARAVVKNSVNYNEETLLDIVQQALKQLPEGNQNITLLAHPGDVELIRRAAGHQGEKWKIIGDATIASGGCVVKTEHSYIDYTLDRQFQLTLESMVRNSASKGASSAPDVPAYTSGLQDQSD